MKEYDVLVIGSGPGGYVAAIRAAQLGLSVACVEKGSLGGTCLNRGCIPTKTMLASSDLLAAIAEGAQLGVTVQGASADMEAIQNRKNKVVATLQQGIVALFKKNKVEKIAGVARLLDRHQVRITSDDGDETVRAKDIILATGSKVARPSVFPFGERILTSDEVLNLTALPESILIVGGGIIGVEFACFFRDMGCAVTIVEMLDRLVSVLDADIAKELERAFKKRKIKLHLSTRIEKLEETKSGVCADIGADKAITADLALVAVGRTLVTDDIGLDDVGIKLGDNGVIATNEFLQTSVPNIYAIGDVNGRWQLAHSASHQGIVAAENIAGKQRRWSDRVNPSCVYTRPEIGTLGMTEAQAAEAVGEIAVFKYPLRSLGKAQASNELEGFVKMIVEKSTNEVVGLHIIGARATDMIAAGVLGMDLQATAREFARAIHPHPTFSEGIMECAAALLGEGIHS